MNAHCHIHLDKGFLHERYINVVWAQFWFCTSMTVHVKAHELWFTAVVIIS